MAQNVFEPRGAVIVNTAFQEKAASHTTLNVAKVCILIQMCLMQLFHNAYSYVIVQ